MLVPQRLDIVPVDFILDHSKGKTVRTIIKKISFLIVGTLETCRKLAQ